MRLGRSLVGLVRLLLLSATCGATFLGPVAIVAQQTGGEQATSSGDARLRNTVDTTLVTVGDRLRLLVSIDHAAGARVIWPDSINVAPFEVLGAQAAPPVADGDRVQSGLVLTLIAFELGELEIPSFDVTVEGPGETFQTLPTDRFGIEVISVGQDESGDIRDIRGPLSIPVGVVTISVWLLVLMASALLAWWLYRRWRKRPGAPELTPIAPPRPADEVALEALDRIEGSDLLLRGEVKEYHIEVSDVLRHYVEDRFDVRALEMTTREVMRGLESADVELGFRGRLLRFLDQCDLVKFAKARPDADASRSVLELGRELVRMGGAKPPASPTQPEESEAVHEEAAQEETLQEETLQEETLQEGTLTAEPTPAPDPPIGADT